MGNTEQPKLAAAALRLTSAVRENRWAEVLTRAMGSTDTDRPRAAGPPPCSTSCCRQARSRAAVALSPPDSSGSGSRYAEWRRTCSSCAALLPSTLPVYMKRSALSARAEQPKSATRLKTTTQSASSSLPNKVAKLLKEGTRGQLGSIEAVLQAAAALRAPHS
ncbi:hypothetical protein TSOC_006455 [Tetrabaena socialis]|uniref:Uncharacterized protein n=1 Tax=Tetrabaena socialis TaxID=47790 RepID=A0A2J8A3L3_9CHLO|nr:hypothetical protein TSOC_006455 [Tetrabaena socialis]|eukprot:PNH07119.1 hypothetical protein TSOC_006455 [Tetrabaena socialis]